MSIWTRKYLRPGDTVLVKAKVIQDPGNSRYMKVQFDLGGAGKYAIDLHPDLEIASASHAFRLGDRVVVRRGRGPKAQDYLGTVKALLDADGVPVPALGDVKSLLIKPDDSELPIVRDPRSVALTGLDPQLVDED